MDNILSGKVDAGTFGRRLSGARVEVWDAGGQVARALGTGPVGRGGAFGVVLSEAAARMVEERGLSLEFRLVFQGALVRLDPAVSWKLGMPAEGILLRPAIGADGRDPAAARAVWGRVTGPDDRGARGLVVRAADRDLRAEEPLGEAVTGADGAYAIGYSPRDYARGEKAAADLVVRVFDPEGKRLLFEPRPEDIRFNAPADLRFDIRLSEAPPAAGTEYQRVAAALKPLLGRLGPADLAEDEKNRDITFLSGETGIAAEKLEHFALAQRMGGRIGAEPTVFYALLRMATLLDTAPASPPFRPVRVAVTLQDDTDRLLHETAAVDPARIRKDVDAAVSAALVPRGALEALPDALEALERFGPGEAGGEGETTRLLDLAGRLMQPDKAREIAALLARGTDDLPGLLADLAGGRLFDLSGTAAATSGPGLASALAPAGLGLADIAGAAGLSTARPAAELAALPAARLDEAIRKAAPHLPDKAVAIQRQRLARRLDAEAPAAAAQARIASGRMRLSDPARAERLFARRPDLDIKRANLDKVFAEERATQPADRKLLAELKVTQRLAKLAPDLDSAEALKAQGIGSGADIVAKGRSRFMEETAPAAGLSRTEARATYDRAARAHSAALMIAGEARDLVAAAPAAAPSTSIEALLTASPNFPNLQSLFKGTDLCACEHCRSVYSPAAYLVELIQFLDQRSMVDLTQIPPVQVNLARKILFSRRPEIADLDLDCDNAEVPLPYIDLVCEVLEEQIAPDPGVPHAGAVPAQAAAPAALLATLRAAGWTISDEAIVQAPDINGDLILRDKAVTAKLVDQGGNNWLVFRLRNTRSSAAELAAAPEYVSAAAYASLKAAPHAFGLPFDLDHAEATAYFARFGLSRADLMDHLQVAGAPADAEIAAERLGLTDGGHQLVVNADATAAGQAAIWAMPAAQVVARMTVVETFLDKTGLDYAGLERLLQLDFIDPSGVHFIRHLDLSCDLTQKEVAGLDPALLDRVHRFLRLQRATGWSDTALDAALTDPSIGNGTLDDAALVALAGLDRISARTGLRIEELTGCFGRIAHAPMSGEAPPVPLYQRLFQDKSVLGYLESGLDPETVASGAGAISVLAAPLAAVLKLTAADFELLRAGLTDDALTFANLSHLYGAARLVARLKLKAADLLTLMARTGTDPFADPAAMLDFVRAAERAKSGPVKLADIDYMLEHTGPDVAVKAIGDDRVVTLLTQLQADLQTAYLATRSAFDATLNADEHRGAIKAALLGLPGIDEAAANDVLRMYDADWNSPPDPVAGPTLAALLGASIDTVQLAADEAAVAAAANPAALEASRLAMAQTLLSAISDQLFTIAKAEVLNRSVAGFFRADEALTTSVLAEGRLLQPGPAQPLLAAALTPDALIDMANDPPAPPAVTEAAFPEAFGAVRLLHKLLPLAAALGLGADDLAWLLANGPALGWEPLDGLPWAAGQNPVPQAGWDSLVRAAALFAAWPPAADPADPTAEVTLRATFALLLPGAGTTRAGWLDALALFAGEQRATLDDLDAHFGFSVPDLDAWRLPQTWEALALALADLRKLTVTTAEAVAFARPALTPADSAALRTALKARYDDAIWLTTLGEITNTIRGPRRDALVAWLLANRAEFTTATDLYDHFLIDVQMESKVASSRIVQAHGTIQTFVERSRMGLEPQSAADSADSGWEQWAWMKNYRVWEANRKVFVYPENWIEPELLDDKSTLFTALEDQLLQNEVTDDTTEEAFIRYLEGLDELAFLEVVACYYLTDTGEMHVFARTKGGDPAQYWHRIFIRERAWTTWEKVDLDISSDNLLAFARNGRLYLAWPVISDETDPDADATTPGVSENPSTHPMPKPPTRLNIQLALSEYAGGVWKPKKISQDRIVTPDNYTTDTSQLDKTRFNLMYQQLTDQVWLFSTWQDNDWESHQLNGIFNVAGCKGYPEVVATPTTWLPDFYPDYKDTALQKQRYRELGQDNADTLAIRNVLNPATFLVRLDKTPGTFRVTHPHQFTGIDLLYLLLEVFYLRSFATRGELYQRLLKIPYGTWLPYFFEDSKRAYVVVPGLYARKPNDETRRTASDFFQLMRDIMALIARYVAILTAAPAPDPQAVMDDLAVDPDFLHIEEEMALYARLRFGEDFRNLYHPIVCPLRKVLYQDGVGPMTARAQQLQQTGFDFATTFTPSPIVVQPYPVEDVDFSAEGAYSPYNWELFFHAPLMIAKRLASEQRFEEAMAWYHRIFDPTGSLDGSVPQKYWVTKPFFETANADYLARRIDTILTNLADPSSPERHELEFAVSEWRDKPFRPHVVARYRTVAYQRTVVMNYVGTLIDWGDYLFRQDTMEAITQATQLYVLADKLLGPKPRVVPPPVEVLPETYNQLVADLDAFGNALVEIENFLPDLSVLPEGGDELPSPPLALSSLYFCIPPNENMLAYWGTVADRLFKIRNSQNIDGVERVLALFAPPIDPGALVRAVAAGADLAAVLAGLSAPLPPYRFRVMVAKAADFAGEVRALGQALLSALERKDAEALSLLRNDLEVSLLKAQRDLKVMEIEFAEEQIKVLERTREVTAERNAFYAAFERLSAQEQLNLDKLGAAQDLQNAAQIVRATGAVLGIIPDFAVGGHGAGGSPAIHASFGGSTLAHVADAAANVLTMLSGVASYEASRASALGSADRRFDDAGLQERASSKELAQIDQQINTAKLRRDISAKDLAVHDLQIENASRLSKTMAEQYTNNALYQWIANDITQVYYRAYKLAYDTAKKAERCFQHELGSSESFLAFGYWDSRKKGLQAASKLTHDIKRMDARYLDTNRREYELTKHVSLRRLDPLALTGLRPPAPAISRCPKHSSTSTIRAIISAGSSRWPSRFPVSPGPMLRSVPGSPRFEPLPDQGRPRGRRGHPQGGLRGGGGRRYPLHLQCRGRAIGGDLFRPERHRPLRARFPRRPLSALRRHRRRGKLAPGAAGRTASVRLCHHLGRGPAHSLHRARGRQLTEGAGRDLARREGSGDRPGAGQDRASHRLRPEA